MKASKKLNDFDPSRYLVSDEAIAAYLESVMQENDAGLLVEALGDIAKARGMTAVAQESGITREALYKALRSDAQPRFETILKVLGAIGVQMKFAPARKKPSSRRPAAQAGM
jgi:probable addiction module antidote protein